MLIKLSNKAQTFAGRQLADLSKTEVMRTTPGNNLTDKYFLYIREGCFEVNLKLRADCVYSRDILNKPRQTVGYTVVCVIIIEVVVITISMLITNQLLC